MAVSIRDVAKAAGVSVSSVSRALNGYTDVNERTRKKIQETARELGYSPNVSAKNLSTKGQKNVALLVIDMGTNDSLFYGDMIHGVYNYASKAMKDSIIATYGVDSSIQKSRQLDNLCSDYSLSGVFIMGLRVNDAYHRQAKKLGIPCVLMDVKTEGKNTSSILTDDRQAFEDITDYVLDNGHREIVLIKGREEAEVTQKRMQGFRNSIKKHGMDIHKIPVFSCDFDEQQAYEKTKDYIQKYGTSKATAFICMSDLMALGVCRAVEESGFCVPEDFSVTGFDGLDILRYFKPGITTVDQQIEAKAYAGTEMLMGIMETGSTPPPLYYPHKLIIRDSVKKLDNKKQ